MEYGWFCCCCFPLSFYAFSKFSALKTLLSLQAKRKIKQTCKNQILNSLSIWLPQCKNQKPKSSSQSPHPHTQDSETIRLTASWRKDSILLIFGFPPRSSQHSVRHTFKSSVNMKGKEEVWWTFKVQMLLMQWHHPTPILPSSPHPRSGPFLSYL